MIIDKLFKAKTFGQRYLVLHVLLDKECWYAHTNDGYKVTNIVGVDLVKDAEHTVLKFTLWGLCIMVGTVHP